MALPEWLLLFQCWGRDERQPLLSQHVAKAQEGCEKQWLHRHGIQICSLPLQHDQYLHKYHPAIAKGIFLVLTNFGKGCCSADGKMSFLCLQMEILSSNVSSQMLLSSLMLNQWHSKTDLFWLSRDHPLLKTAFSFPCGRQHSPQSSAAAGALVLPLQPSPRCDLPLWLVSLLPDLSCPLNSFSAYFAVSFSLHQQGCSPAPLENWERRTHPLTLGEPPCSPSPAVLSQFSKSFSLCHLSLSTCQRTILKSFWLYLNLVNSTTYFCIQDVNVASLKVREIPVTHIHSN